MNNPFIHREKVFEKCPIFEIDKMLCINEHKSKHLNHLPSNK